LSRQAQRFNRDIQHNLTILSPLEITEESYRSGGPSKRRRNDAAAPASEASVALIALQLIGALF
jgi:hypothetical protein